MPRISNEGPPPVHVSFKAPHPVMVRLDRLAESAGLTRSEFLRLVLQDVSESAVPPGLVAAADRLRTARAAR